MKSIGTFGTRLRDARKELKMTQKAVAELIGAKHNSVSDWENDKNMPDPDTIVRLCEVLSIDPSYLLLDDSSDVKGNAGFSEILYISRPSGNMEADEVRKFLHESIDQMSDSDLLLFKDFTLRLKK